MKKVLLLLIIATPSIYSMQRVATQSFVNSLPSSAAMSNLTQAMRQYGSKNTDTITSPVLKSRFPLRFEKVPLTRDYSAEANLKNKYPSISVPPIYKHSHPKLSQAAHHTNLNPFKQGYTFYNPSKISDKEFVLLHELGHYRHENQIRFMAMLKKSMRISIILATFFKLLSIKYGILGAIFAPKLFWNCYMRFYEEPSADNFAIKHAYHDKRLLQEAKQSLEKMPFAHSRTVYILFDHNHPSNKSRINKIQRAIDNKPDYFKIARIILILSIVEYVVNFAYTHSKNEISIKEGLKKLQDIEDNFEQECNKWDIPQDGRPTYKYALGVLQNYLQTKLIKLQEKNIQVTEKEIIK